MSTRPNQTAALYAKYAKSTDLIELFTNLAERAVIYARMQDEFLAAIVRHREARTGKPLRYTKRQTSVLEEFDRDAEQAEKDIERLAAELDDCTLLSSALSGEYQQLGFDVNMASSFRPEDKVIAEGMIEFRRETIRLIEHFIETSAFRGQVTSPAQKKK